MSTVGALEPVRDFDRGMQRKAKLVDEEEPTRSIGKHFDVRFNAARRLSARPGTVS